MTDLDQWLAARFNREDFMLYARAGDDCMMEGISSEAASLAGHLQLSDLCWIYDSNRVTIESHTDITFTEDVAARFLAYGWNVATVADANDLDQISRAFRTFQPGAGRPTLVLVHGHIGYGSPVEDSPKAHGAPFGPEGVRATKRVLGIPLDDDFHIPDSLPDWFARGIGARGAELCTGWEKTSNIFPQAEALAFGKAEQEIRPEVTPPEVVPHRVTEGNRPTNVLLGEVLTPHLLGFDQWGWSSARCSRHGSSPNSSPTPNRNSPTTRATPSSAVTGP